MLQFLSVANAASAVQCCLYTVNVGSGINSTLNICSATVAPTVSSVSTIVCTVGVVSLRLPCNVVSVCLWIL